MASIDDIWDAPVTPNSPKTPRLLDRDDDEVEVQRPSKRQKQALFLSDSEDEAGESSRIGRSVVRAPPPVTGPGMDDDVEAMFADAEKDEGLSFKRIGDLDLAAMEREAEERHRRPLPLTPHPVMPSSSPARDDGTSGNGAGGSKNDKGKEAKKRARPVPLNETLLLGPTGFPELISQVKDFKVKGKGREVALSVWRDEANGKTRDPDGDLSLDSDEDEADQNRAVNEDGGTRHASSEVPNTPRTLLSAQETDHDQLSLPPSSRASSQPLTSDFPDEDDLFGPSTSLSTRPNGVSTSTSAVTKKRLIVDDDDDDEESLWRDLESANTIQAIQQQQSSESRQQSVQSQDDLDAEMWAALEATSAKSASGNARVAPGEVDEMDVDDDEMWDIIRENEKSVPSQRPAASSSTAAAKESAPISTKGPV
ncbi:hypothetical protein NP233_g8545 [Leucocoprinus birnbaumii]|uniref:Chromosome segregation in meiosis protein n=1 Tax=Leucocoprinus birnbaumii TaxID=56174 RepID=A0AAD5YNZ1_9AGAR|nr:hypothetical protein NP233_g8545 [Leucocoprinus birnbaumii]